MTEQEWCDTLRSARAALLEAIQHAEAAERAAGQARVEQGEAAYRLRLLQDEFDVWLMAGERERAA